MLIQIADCILPAQLSISPKKAITTSRHSMKRRGSLLKLMMQQRKEKAYQKPKLHIAATLHVFNCTATHPLEQRQHTPPTDQNYKSTFLRAIASTSWAESQKGDY